MISYEPLLSYDFRRLCLADINKCMRFKKKLTEPKTSDLPHCFDALSRSLKFWALYIFYKYWTRACKDFPFKIHENSIFLFINLYSLAWLHGITLTKVGTLYKSAHCGQVVTLTGKVVRATNPDFSIKICFLRLLRKWQELWKKFN